MAFTRNLIITIFVTVSTLAHFVYVQETIGNNETTTAAPLIPSSFGSISLNELNETFHQILFNTANLTNQWQYELLNTSTAIVSNLTKHLESLNNNTLVHMLYNTSLTSMETGTNVFTESIARPATFFVGQNLRLLGSGLWSLGHSLKHSGYHISNLEPVIQNVSQTLSEYGINLVNASIQH
ncbi:uncharacterized protein LOC124500208 [Dermatophagoides farinae]|uniref:Uncharacterized protein n=1 Tax=Dermatophagoides farinae TaxID=6954 RepID=A0A922HZQ6_DERFA|nr:uncharacterized protein LOC124500208 [Dermatophagoides farinae]KAH7646592.1 hypothetical protein HUG17_2130 [Dermatophagoides farinae]KAH9517113.1 hypothetical protein DERF_007810 [Dermatophagoides farinae]